MVQLQHGAHMVSEEDAQGAEVASSTWRSSGLLKRKFQEEGSGMSNFEALQRSQTTTLDEAKWVNKAMDDENKQNRALLRAQADLAVSLHPQHLWEALECNVFCPTFQLEYLGEADLAHLRGSGA